MNRRAVIISLSEDGSNFRLSLDDATSSDGKTWALSEHYTHKQLAKTAIEKVEFSEKELADFGHAILSRIHAFQVRGES